VNGFGQPGRPLSGIVFGPAPVRPAEPPRFCPHCGADSVAPIAYGYPGTELFEAAERGEIILGGCIVRSEQPTWQCRNCGGNGRHRIS
jgi:hypothetical protein